MKPSRHYCLLLCILIFFMLNGCLDNDSSGDNRSAPLEDVTPLAITGTTCDCGSTDQTDPCTGRGIVTRVDATTINRVGSVDAIFGWSFNSNGQAATCGQFANGDFWIAPATGETTVTITAITGSDTVSVDADPVMESLGLLDGSNNYGNYNAAENIVPNLPVTYSTTTSLVAAIQRNESATGECGTGAIVGECVDAYQVVTILPSVPVDAGSTVLRPNITGQSKVMLSLSDFDFTRIPAKAYLIGTDAAGYEAMRQRWSHSTEIFSFLDATTARFSEGGRAYRSHIIIDDYGSGTAVAFNSDLMTIFSDENSLPEKQAALAAMLSYGLDLYHGYFNAPAQRFWAGIGGHNPGKYVPVAFMASLLNDATYANKIKAEAATIDTVYDDLGPQELGQIHASPGRTPVYGHYKSTNPIGAANVYWRDLLQAQCYDGATGTCNTVIGNKTQKDPYGYIDGPAPKPGTGYMGINLGVSRSMLAIMAIMPEVNATVNYPLLKDYILGLDNDGLDTAGDPCVTPDEREDPLTCDPKYYATTCQYYGITWGPGDPTDAQSTCIQDDTLDGGHTQIGRFTFLHGTSSGLGYTTRQVEDNWNTIITDAGW